MIVEYSGWTASHGTFHCNVFVDENKKDYELHLKNGEVMKQSTEFHFSTHDWNNDGDIYTQFGAFFVHTDEQGGHNGGVFWTPEDMVFAIVEAYEKEKDGRRIFDHEVVKIPGLEIPPLDKRPTLEDHIRDLERGERRKEAQEIERNRKMHQLGIRGPDEPWAK